MSARIPSGLGIAHNRLGAILYSISADDAALIVCDYIDMMGLRETVTWARLQARTRKRKERIPRHERDPSVTAERDPSVTLSRPCRVPVTPGPSAGSQISSDLVLFSPDSKADPRGNVHSPGAREGARRGTRLAPDWQPSAGLAASLSLSADAARGHRDRFVDYWTAKPGRDGLKLDWDATFRNWVRRSADFARAEPKSGSRILQANPRPEEAPWLDEDYGVVNR